MYREEAIDQKTMDAEAADARIEARIEAARQAAEVGQRYDDEIADLVEDIRAYQARMAILQEKIDDHKEQLREYLEKRGENWKDDEGYARIISQGLRNFYRSKDLDRLIVENPEKYGYLKDFRRESIVRSSVQVK